MGTSQTIEEEVVGAQQPLVGIKRTVHTLKIVGGWSGKVVEQELRQGWSRVIFKGEELD